MPLSKDDRLAFSLYIVSADEQIRGLNAAKALLQSEVDKTLKLDTANKNLSVSTDSLILSYQSELNLLDGNLRTIVTEQNIVDSANKKLRNYFFPNDVTASVPSLSASHNVWTQVSPFALTYAIGKNYTEGYDPTQKEGDIISSILALISSTSSYTDYELTTGTEPALGSCDNPTYTDQASCVSHGGIWTPGSGYVSSSAIQTIKSNMVTAVNSLISFLNNEVSIINSNGDTTAPNQSNNSAAVSNINSVIIPALNTWLAYPDFSPSGSGPSKLHSTQMTTLQTALNNRTSFISTRISQIAAVLGTIVQDVSNGLITSSSGLYGKRYGFISLRLNVVGGSLQKLIGLQASSNGQDATVVSILGSKSTYMSVVPTSSLKAPGNGTATISVSDSTLFSVGDTVYIAAVGQEELQRAVKSASNGVIVLNDIVPAKFRPAEKARIYKDIS